MVGIIGAGASGMAAAITALKRGKEVTLFEKNDRVGKKLAATGNGRCNLTNTGVSVGCYDTQNKESLKRILTACSTERVAEFFASVGMPLRTEDGGRVYPYCGLASAVVDVLRLALVEHGANLRTGVCVKSASKRGGRFVLDTEDGGSFCCDSLVVACGGLAAKQLGGTKSGYELLRSFGHKTAPLLPVLTPVITDSEPVRPLKGVRARAKVTLFSGNDALYSEVGEVQFNDYGLSGIPVLNASFAAARELSKGKTPFISLDFFPELETCALEEELRKRRENFGDRDMTLYLAGLLHRRIAEQATKRAGIALLTRARDLSDKNTADIADALKRFVLKVHSVKQFDAAQVSAGGALLSEFDVDTMESKLVPELYAAGEVLDVAGMCGGFNLHFAWATGIACGSAVR